MENRLNLKCRHCGDLVVEERVDAGYDYCLKPSCVEACIRPLSVVAVAVKISNCEAVVAVDIDATRAVQNRAPRFGLRQRPPAK